MRSRMPYLNSCAGPHCNFTINAMQRPIIFILILLSGINLFGQHLNEKKRDLRKKNKIEKVLTFRHHLATKDSIADGEETFDREGNTILDIRFNDKGKSRVRYVLEYANNLMVKQTMYDEKEQVTNFLVYRYDANGNQTLFVSHVYDASSGSLTPYRLAPPA